MPCDLYAFGLKPEYVHSAENEFAQWIAGLGTFLEFVAGRMGVVLHYSVDPDAAPWVGKPFILVGNAREVDDYLGRLPDSARDILRDCGYYWILSRNVAGCSVSDSVRASSHLAHSMASATVGLATRGLGFRQCLCGAETALPASLGSDYPVPAMSLTFRRVRAADLAAPLTNLHSYPYN